QAGPVAGSQTRLLGNPDMTSEKLMAYEIGVQMRPLNRVSVSVATFYNVYDDLRATSALPVQPGVPVIFPATDNNAMTGESLGFEIGPVWQVTDRWRLQASYTFFEMALHAKPGRALATSESAEGTAPRQQFSLRSSLDLPRHWQLDAGIRYVDGLPALGVPAYLVTDVRLAWQATKDFEFSVVGQNLMDRSHFEYVSSFVKAAPVEIQQSVYAQVVWRF
ncbi:MAG TPA: TonB-dependent receptor, partial [Verrucomicrobiae bacterium]|nr:TonB-dependent receptor [Verrucomicrobiae bacterium]